MRRRDFVALLVGTLAVWLLGAQAQQGVQAQVATRQRRVGLLLGGDTPESRLWFDAFRQALRNIGWIDGQNLRIDVRWSGGSDIPRIREDTAEMISQCDVIVTGTSVAVAQVLRTSKVPVVFAGITDPVAQGFVKSLSRPESNATGFTAYEASLGGKWIETLKEIAPHLAHAAIVYEPETAPYMRAMAQSVIAASPSFGVNVSDRPVHDIAELEAVISDFGQQRDAGLIVPPGGFTLWNSALIVALTAKHRLPAVYAFRSIVAAGGLIAYAVDRADQFARAAGYVDQIFKGLHPSDLPVQGPTRFQLVINLKTAKALGLTVAPTLLARADEVIE